MGRIRPRRRDRGATIVEYALVLSLFVVVIVGGLEVITSSAETELESSSRSIGEPAPAPLPNSTSTTFHVTTTTIATTTTIGPTTTVKPTTTTIKPTTTTVPPTTTTAKPPTTTTRPPGGSQYTAISLPAGQSSIEWHNGTAGKWHANISFVYPWRNGGTVTVEVTRHLQNGKTQVHTESVWVGGGGSTTTPYLQTHTISRGASTNVTSVTVRVINIRTADENWIERDYPVNGPSTTRQAPRV